MLLIKTTEPGLQLTGTNDQKKIGRQVISAQITKDSASTRSAHGFVPFSGEVHRGRSNRRIEEPAQTSERNQTT